MFYLHTKHSDNEQIEALGSIYPYPYKTSINETLALQQNTLIEESPINQQPLSEIDPTQAY